MVAVPGFPPLLDDILLVGLLHLVAKVEPTRFGLSPEFLLLTASLSAFLRRHGVELCLAADAALPLCLRGASLRHRRLSEARITSHQAKRPLGAALPANVLLHVGCRRDVDKREIQVRVASVLRVARFESRSPCRELRKRSHCRAGTFLAADSLALCSFPFGNWHSWWQLALAISPMRIVHADWRRII